MQELLPNRNIFCQFSVKSRIQHFEECCVKDHWLHCEARRVPSKVIPTLILWLAVSSKILNVCKVDFKCHEVKKIGKQKGLS